MTNDRNAPARRTAVILAGGRGTRLRPYTTAFPKPLMPVGHVPILEIVVRQLTAAGFTDLVFAVGHLAALIEAYFGDGARFGIAIRYSREEQPLGTAAPMVRIPDLPDHFLALNGDLLTDLDYAAFFEQHRSAEPCAALTIATARRSVPSEFGVITTDANGHVTEYAEKPQFDFQVSTGVYAFSREALRHIPDTGRFDFPDLVQALLAADIPVTAREHTGLWLDIGRREDYERADQVFSQHRARLLPAVEVGAGGISVLRR